MVICERARILGSIFMLNPLKPKHTMV